MRIIQVASGSPPQSGEGPTLVVDCLSVALARLGHSMSVLYARGSVCEPRPYTIEGFKTWRGGHSVHGSTVRYVCFAVSSSLKLLQLLRTENYDVVHFHTTTAAFFGLNIAKRYQVPAVFTYHNPLLSLATDDKKQVETISPLLQGMPKIIELCSRFLESYVVRRVAKVIALTATMKENIVKYFGLDPSMVEVIPAGVDTDLFNPDAASSRLRQKFSLGDDVSVIMCVASIERRKNQLALVKATAKIVPTVPDVKVMLVGRITDPTYLAEIQDYVKNTRLQDKVVFTDHIDPQLLPQYYNLCDVFVLPSLAEGLPAVILQAMSCCRAIVVPALPQYTEVAKHGDEFLVVDSLDPDAISQAILSILKDEERKIKLGLSARRTATAFFDWKNIGVSTAEFYKSLQDYFSDR